MSSVSFEADAEAAVAEEPDDGAFDLPPVPAEALLGFDPGAGLFRGGASFAQPGAVFGGVVGRDRSRFGGHV